MAQVKVRKRRCETCDAFAFVNEENRTSRGQCRIRAAAGVDYWPIIDGRRGWCLEWTPQMELEVEFVEEVEA